MNNFGFSSYFLMLYFLLSATFQKAPHRFKFKSKQADLNSPRLQCIWNKHKNNETMETTPSSGTAVYIDSPKMVTPPVTIN